MKQTVLAMVAAIMLASVGYSAMDDKDYNLSLVGNVTNSATYVLRGLLQGVYVDAPDGTLTGVVTVATAHEVLFTNSITADGMYRPRVGIHTTAGAAATFIAYSNTAATASAGIAQTWYAPAAMAGEVTVRILQDGAGTNWTVTLIYDK